MHYSESNTTVVMISGFCLALIVDAAFYSYVFGKDWMLLNGFPVGWLSAGMGYMNTFFHEIGHTLFAWLYGFATIPIFDFKHGGGYAVSFSGQNYIIVAMMASLLGYGIYYVQGHIYLQLILGFCLALGLTTFLFENIYASIIDFMGPAFVPLVSTFFLIRALFDLAPRGVLERFLNAFFGFGMIMGTLTEGYALLNSAAYRLIYFNQKGSHGFGDFDKIASRWQGVEFEHVVYTVMTLSIICLIIPFILFLGQTAKSKECYDRL